MDPWLPGDGTTIVVPTLFVIRGADQGTRFELTELPVRLGRDASNTIQVHDTEASRHHAEIRLAARATAASISSVIVISSR